MINQRAAHRPLSLLKGRVIFPDRRPTLDCVVRDLSDAGARLQIGHHVTVPDRFDLYVPLKETTYCVHVRWRRSEEIGVMFNGGMEPPASLGAEDFNRRIQRLEEEVGELRRWVSALQARLGPPS
jgi:PilZ domain